MSFVVKNIFFVCLLLSVVSTLHAARTHPERWYQMQWQTQYGGQLEVVLPDRTRCDLINAEYAIEFDFADKWAAVPFIARRAT